MKSIMVTGIGGVVGQGILRNIRAMGLDVPIIGVNVDPVSAGNHLCDQVFKVPFAHDPAYTPFMQSLIERCDVALVIPSTDYEAYHLALGRDLLTATVAGSPAEVSGFCLDKYLNFQRFSEHGIPFAPSALPSEYRGQFARTVVKPREGRGSRNIHVDPGSPADFSDDYVVQQFLDGPELTTTFYVRQSGALHGFITFARELELGNTVRCEVVTAHDAEIGRLIGQMLHHFPFRGSCNLQCRVTHDGIIPFEINCRISGTNSVRSQFGFPDVAYCVQELYLGVEPQPPAITRGSALRIMLDIIYPGRSLDEIHDRHDPFRIS
jgi:carbamoyl-phosphate synthase large subunit